jgi:hypothetical protein
MDALPYMTESLDSVPEAARSLYREEEGRYVLPVDGVAPAESVKKLETTLARLKEERDQIKALNDKDRQELERISKEREEAEQQKAMAEGRWEEVREKLQSEHRQQLERREQQIHKLAVRSQLKDALVSAGVLPEYLDDAFRALNERGPKAKDVGDDVVGVFPDEIHGDRPIGEFVAEWAKGKEAAKYLPPKTGGGGGASGDRGTGATFTGKKYADMNHDEKAAYLASKYGEA